MMADAGLSGSEDSYPGEISSGVRRRVEIVRALMNEPKVLLFDEPYRALDSLTKSVMHEALLETYYKNKVTIFFITHDIDEALFLVGRLLEVDPGGTLGDAFELGFDDAPVAAGSVGAQHGGG